MNVRANWQTACAGVALLFAAGLAVAAVPAGGVYDVRAHGAAGDGAALDTAAIQAAIDACAAAAGGVVSFPPGAYLTGTVYLKSGVHLRVEQGATVLGSTNLADYPVNTCAHASRSDEYTVRALIWGEGLEDVGITGAGVLDGQGAAFRGKTATDAEVAEASRALTAEGRYPVHPRYAVRPYLIRLISCRNVLVEGVTMRNSAMWMQHYLDCDFLTVRGITVWNHVSGNNDMIDLDGCRNVVVSDCVGDSDDDALTLKSTGPRATEHVVVTNCILRSHCNAIKMGTESAGGFRDIAISNCVIQRSQSRPADGEQLSGRVDGISGISLELVDGGVLERVSISNIVVEGTAAPLFMRLGNRGKTPKPGDPKPAAGVMRDIAVSNITATGAGVVGCAFSGIPGHCIENVSLSNISIRFAGGGKTVPLAGVPEAEDKYPEAFMFGGLPAYGLFFRHVRGLTVRDVRLGFDADDPRPAVVCDDVQGMRLDGLQARAVPGAAAQVLLRDTRDLLVTGCTADNAAAFLAEAGGCADIRLLNNDTDRAKKERVKAR